MKLTETTDHMKMSILLRETQTKTDVKKARKIIEIRTTKKARKTADN